MQYPKNVKQRYNDPLTRISWQNFERLLASYYTEQGYRVEHVGTGGAGMTFDGGIDLKLHRAGQYLIVQCKHWNVRQVTHNPVHELLGVMLTQLATGAIVITSGEFTRAAKAAAAREPRVTLIDGAALREMLGPIAGLFSAGEADYSNAGSGVYFDGAAANPSNYRTEFRRRTRSRNPLPSIAFAIVAGLVFYAVAMQTIRGLLPKTSGPSAAPVAPPPLFATRAAMAPSAAPVTALAPSTPPPKYPVTHTTAAEQREWQRKNDEAMKILEKTTPALER